MIVTRRLDRDAAGIERHAFADQDDRRSTAPLVLEHDEAGFLRTALSDGEERSHPFLLYLRLVHDGDAESVRRRQLPGQLGEIAGRADVARLHLQVTREQIAGRNGVPDAAPRLGFVFVGGLDYQLDGLEVGLRVLRLPLELGELPPTLSRTLDEHLRQLGGAETAARFFRDRQGERLGPQAARALGRDRRGATDCTPRDLARFPDTHQQDALRLAAAVDKEGLVFLSLVVAGGDCALDARIDRCR